MRLFALFAWLPIAAVPILPALAQEPPTFELPNATKGLATDTLDKALPFAAWDAARQGALLAIDPQHTRVLPGQEPLPPDARPGASSLRALAARYGRQIVAAPSLTILAPVSMVVLNTRPGKPDIYAGLERWKKIHLLMGSLSPAQWQKLGSSDGLGMGDLTGEQQPLFLSLLPQPFALHSFKMDRDVKLAQPTKNIALSPEQRAGVRLRVYQAAQHYLAQPNGQFGFPSDLPYHALPDQTEFFTLASHNFQPRPDSYGVALRAEVPNRPKPGQLDFHAPGMETSVSVEDVKTVDDLIKRVAQATHQEMFADGRVAKLPVVARGRAAKAGDLLQGLCLAVTGTFRRVGSAYVLTDDLEGIGSRRARLADWALDAQAQQQAALDRAETAAIAQHPERFVHFDSNDVFGFAPAELKILTANGPEQGFLDQYEVPLAALPAGQQKVIEAVQTHQLKPVGDHVKVALTTNFSYIVPGIGAVGEDDSSMASIGLPRSHTFVQPPPEGRIALPASLATRALIVAPVNEGETARFALQAKRHGFNQLWVEVADGAAGSQLLADAAAKGKANGLAVVAVVRLLQIPGENGKTAPDAEELRDRNLLNETGSAHAAKELASLAAHANEGIRLRYARTEDWLNVEPPAVRARLERRLHTVAETPGLSGLALADVAAPGYQEMGDTPTVFEYTTDGDFGYTPAMRLRFLRQAGYDPVDLAGGNNPSLQADLSLPFFPDVVGQFRFNGETGQMETAGPRTPIQDWKAFRYQTGSRLLDSLHGFLRASYPNLPVWMRHDPILDGWWASWEKPEQRPRHQPATQEKTSEQAAQISARPLLLNIAYAGSLTPDKVPSSPALLASWVQTRLTQRNKGWNGVTLDLRALPSTTALTALEALVTP